MEADLPAQLVQKPSLAGEQLGAAPRAKPGDHPRRLEGLQPSQGRGPLRRVAAGQRGTRAVNDQRAGEEHGLIRQGDGRAGRGRNLVEWQEIDRDRGIADRGAVREGVQARRIDGGRRRKQPDAGLG